MRLIYLSAVPWASFSQRPHKFVEWFRARTGGEVLWVDPYPTRFPRLQDRHRLGAGGEARLNPVPDWLRRLGVRALPLEPLPGSALLNAPLWRDVRREVRAFAASGECLLALGKPSVLGLALLDDLADLGPRVRSVYDAMDDFPAFYRGWSRRSMQAREHRLATRAGTLLASSTALVERFRALRPDVRLVRNGLDAAALPASPASPAPRGRRVLGYVGTVGEWFDWDWVVAAARARPQDTVRLIGPTFSAPPARLPDNVERLPQVGHREALEAMARMDVGLIPFRRTDLTRSVDPIKYYEYRALGLPVVSTDFGEMRFRRDAPGTFVSEGEADAGACVEAALRHVDPPGSIEAFVAANTWTSRFDAAALL